MAAVIALLAMADAGVVTGGDPLNAALLLGPLQHRPEFHFPVATGAGQRRNAIAIALHQEIHDLLLEVLAEIHHVVLHAQLLTDPGCIHQTLGAARSLAAHQPEGEALHLPARFHEQRRGEGAIHTA